MDVLCPICAEPIDNDEFHEIDGKTYSQAVRDFQRRGCVAVGLTCSKTPDIEKASCAHVLYDMLGDDMDGASAMFADQGWV